MGITQGDLVRAYASSGRILVTPNGYVRLIFRIKTRSEALELCSGFSGARSTYIKRRHSFDVYIAKQECLREALLLLRRAYEVKDMMYPHELTLAQTYLDTARRERLGIAMRLRRYTMRRQVPLT